MKNSQMKRKLMLGLLCLLGVSSIAQAEKGSLESAREYLSDPQRVGSLAGTILGGALTAHPAGALAGSVIGFFVGKQSMFKPSQAPELQQARRSIIPVDSLVTEEPPQMLALNSSEPIVENEITPLEFAQSVAGSVPAVVVTDAPMSPLEFQAQPPAKDISPLQKIAAYCYGDETADHHFDAQLQAMCYYHQSAG